MKVIVAGGRYFSDYALAERALDLQLHDIPSQDLEIVSGGAAGADQCGEQYGSEWGLLVTVFPADWTTLGKSAGLIRNVAMAQYADVLVAFWDGQSRGTKHMIDTALKYGLEVHVYRYTA